MDVARKPRRFWFLASPAHFAFGFVLFLLPWVEVKCNESPSPIGKAGQVMVHQSGFEAVYGGSRYPADIKPAEIIKDLSNLRFPNLPKNSNAPEFNKPPEGASLMAAYAGVLALGILAGILLRRSRLRAWVLGICWLTAFSLLLVQILRGFPITESVQYEIQRAEEEWLEKLYQHGNSQDEIFARPPRPFLMNYSWFLDISLLLPWIGLGTVLWESGVYRHGSQSDQ
jgi:hypothetical protein